MHLGAQSQLRKLRIRRHANATRRALVAVARGAVEPGIVLASRPRHEERVAQVIGWEDVAKARRVARTVGGLHERDPGWMTGIVTWETLRLLGFDARIRLVDGDDANLPGAVVLIGSVELLRTPTSPRPTVAPPETSDVTRVVFPPPTPAQTPLAHP